MAHGQNQANLGSMLCLSAFYWWEVGVDNAKIIDVFGKRALNKWAPGNEVVFE